MEKYLKETRLLDYSHSEIKALVSERKWASKDKYEQIRQIYDFVKNEIVFGYNAKDDFKASDVLQQGYGQCNTKSTLLMALLRSVGIPTRTHGFMIDKTMQKGAIVGLTYLLAPHKIIHAWVEVLYDGNWIALEGIIPDEKYYNAIKNKLNYKDDGYYGYAIAVKNNCSESFCFTGTDTYSQSLAITDDLGIFDSPDEFFEKYNNTPTPFKEFLFAKILSRRLNKRLQRIRQGK
ncbi:MAG: transglutaminase-like domain-containing protein [Bacillota bacterium]